MKQVHVSAAIILHEGKIFVTQRGYGEFKDWWELPGGKIEAGESKEECLKREIKEELDCRISVDEFLMTVEYDYETFHLTMECFLCSLLEGEHLKLLEAEAAKFVTEKELDSVPFLPADLLVLPKLKEHLSH